MTGSQIVVLYAEDSDDDAFLMRRAFAQAKFPGRLVVVGNGLEALAYLVGEGRYANRAEHPLPAFILLDIKMPHMSGLEVLQWIRARNKFGPMPVVVLTSSSQPLDIAAAYAHGADGYLVKPSNLDIFADLVADLTAACGQPRPPQGNLKVRGCVPAPCSR
jgi:two-component system response regulator